MIRRPYIAVGLIGFGHRTLTETLLSTVTAGMALHDSRRPVDPTTTAFKAYEYADLEFSKSLWATSGDDWHHEQGEDPSDPKVIRRRFREALAALRGPEPVFLPPVAVKPGKRAARRTGARSREQRTR